MPLATCNLIRSWSKKVFVPLASPFLIYLTGSPLFCEDGPNRKNASGVFAAASRIWPDPHEFKNNARSCAGVKKGDERMALKIRLQASAGLMRKKTA